MLFFCDKDTCLEEADPYPLFLVWICCHLCSKFVQLLAYFIGIVSIFQALRTKGNRWRIPVHKREGNKDSCTRNTRKQDQEGPQKIHSYSREIFLHCPMRSKPQEKPSSHMQSFWNVQPLNLCYLHMNITAEKKNFAFSYAMVPLSATKFLQWCQKISVVFLHNPMVVNLMPKLHQLLLLFCPATLNRNGMLQASITVVRTKSCFHKLQPSYFLPLDCLIVTACSRGLTLGFRSTCPHTTPSTTGHQLKMLHTLQIANLCSIPTVLNPIFLTLLFVSMKLGRIHPYLQEPAGCVMLPVTDVNKHTSSDNMDVSEKMHLLFASHHGPNQLLQIREWALEVPAKLSR